MSSPVTPLARAATTRRTLLTGLTCLTLAGCTTGQAVDGPRGQETRSTPAQPALDPDVTVATLALAAERKALDLVVATRDRHPALAAALAPLVVAHEEHVSLLADAVPDDSGSTSPSPQSSPPQDAKGDRTDGVAGEPRRALRDLVRGQRELVTAHKRFAFVAQSGAFARLLASMAAAAAQHEVVLLSASTDGSDR